MNNSETKGKVVTVKLKDAIEIALAKDKRWKIHKTLRGHTRHPPDMVTIRKNCIYLPPYILKQYFKNTKYIVLLIGNNEIGIRPLPKKECNPLPLYSYKLSIVKPTKASIINYGAHIHCKAFLNIIEKSALCLKTPTYTLGHHKCKFEDGVLVIPYNLKTEEGKEWKPKE